MSRPAKYARMRALYPLRSSAYNTAAAAAPAQHYTKRALYHPHQNATHLQMETSESTCGTSVPRCAYRMPPRRHTYTINCILSLLFFNSSPRSLPPFSSPTPPPTRRLPLPALSSANPLIACLLCARRHYRMARRALQQNGAEALRALPPLPSLVHSTRSGSRRDDEQEIPSLAPTAPPPLPPTRLPPRPQSRNVDLDEEDDSGGDGDGDDEFSRCSMRFLREGDRGW